MTAAMSTPRAFYLALVSGLALSYFVTAKLSLLLAIPPGYATAVWQPSGIAVAAMLISGARVWPGIWLGAMLANLTIDGSVPLACAIATGNTLEALTAAWLAERLTGSATEFRRADSVFRFALAVVIGGAAAATVGVAALHLLRRIGPEVLLSTWYTWWQGDVTGMIVVAPFLLAWVLTERSPPPRARGVEVALFATLFSLAIAAVFAFAWWTRPELARTLTFLLIPFMAWAGCRFDQRVVTATILAVAGVAIWATVNNHGPFLFASRNQSLLTLQAFVSTVALMGLVLCALTRERAAVAATLLQARERLEATVAQRTEELARNNQELARDIVEKERLASSLQARETQLAEAQALTHVGSWSWEVTTDRVIWSDELFRIYGISPGQFGGTLADYLSRVHAGDRDRVAQVVQRAMQERQPWELTERIVRPDGSVRMLRTIGRVTTDGAGAVTSMYGACLDVTEMTRIQEIQAAQNQIAMALSYAPSWQDAITGTLRIVCEMLGWRLGQMWEIDPAAEVIRPVVSWHSGQAGISEFAADGQKLSLRRGQGLPGWTWEQAAPVWIEDVVFDPNFLRGSLAERAGLHGALSFPLTAGGRLLGTIEFFSSEVQKPQDEVVHMLAIVGNQLGEYIVRNRSEALLRQSEERFRLLVQGVKDYAIFMLDPDGRVETWNAGAERIKGYRTDEIIGTHFSRFYTPEDLIKEKPERELMAAIADGVAEDEGWRVRKNGTRFWANVVITALYDSEHRLRGFAKVTRDMTERKRVEALEEAGQHTRQFLAMLAHELRNPLAPIRSAISVLQMHELPDHRLQGYLNMIQRQVDHLSRLVDDLLDVSRITSGKIGLQKQRIDAASALSRAVESSRPLVEAKRQSLDIELPREPIWLSGDLTRLSQVVQNLLNNASKYSPAGSRIRLSLRKESEVAVIRVRDEGIGISADFLPRVFELFVQADLGLDRSEGGLGVGLTLVRQIVELHGGTVDAASEGLGRGAQFSVRIPCLAEPGVRELPRVPGDPSAEAVRRILIVDDNRDAADSLALLLRLSRHEVWTAYDGGAALSLAAEHAPEVVLLDIGLPGMDGYEVARRLRELPQTRESLLVALTGYGQAEDRERSNAAGFDDHLVKPVDIDGLYPRIVSRPRATS